MLSALLASDRLPHQTHDWWFTRLWPGSVTASGEIVTPESSLAHATAYACVRVLVDTISSLPCIVYRRRADGGKDRATDTSVYNLLHDTPNDWQTSVEFWDCVAYALVMRGNALAERRQGDTGEPIGRLNLIHPDTVRKVELVGGQVRYHLDGGRELTTEQVFHVRGFGSNPLWGMGSLEAARSAIGLSLATESYGSKLFRDGIRPSGVVQHPGEMSAGAYARLKESINEEHAGKPHRAMILEEGATWAGMNWSPEDSQFLETRGHQREDIAAAFRVPLHKIGAGADNYNGSELKSIEFVTDSIRPLLVRIEAALRRDVLPDGLFAEFLVDALLRGDTAARYAAYSQAITMRIMNPNEVRLRENLNPYEGGDEYRNPAIDKMQDRPSKAEPPKSAAEDKLRQMVGAYAKDIAGRVASREIKELSKRAKHAAGDRERFEAFLQEFYIGHSEYCDTSLSTFCDALELRESDRVSLVKALCESSIDELKNGDPVACVNRWETGALANRIESTIREIVA